MPIGEPESTCSECIDVRRRDLFGAISTDISVADIVTINDDDVGFIGRRGA